MVYLRYLIMANKPRIRFRGFTEDWEQRKLISLYKTIRNAFVGTATPYYTNDSINGYFYLESNNVKNGEINRNNEIYITKDFYEKQENKWLYKDDVVIVQSGHVGHTAVIPEELDKTAAHALIMLQNKKENFDSHFINNSFQTPLIRNKIDEITTGNTIKHILASDVKNIVINIPSFKEQKLISQLFKLLDLNITLHQCKLKKLNLAKKSLLQKLFPRNGSQIPGVRFKGFTDAWEQCKLSELATMNARIGWQNLRTSEFLDNGDYLLITGTDFDNGRIKYSTCHYVEKKRFDQDTKIQLSTGSILITKDGTLGKVALVEELPNPATLNAGVFNVRVKDDAFLSYKYLYHYLKAPFLMKYVTANATGGTIKHLNQSILVDFPIPITEKPEQDRIAKLLDSLESIITLHQRKLERLQEVKKGLLQKMFV